MTNKYNAKVDLNPNAISMKIENKNLVSLEKLNKLNTITNAEKNRVEMVRTIIFNSIFEKVEKKPTATKYIIKNIDIVIISEAFFICIFFVKLNIPFYLKYISILS